MPFCSHSGQQCPFVTSSDRAEDQKEDTSPLLVELSESVFSVEKGSIEVDNPRAKVATVKGQELKIDLERQAKQEEFMKNMGKKFGKKK